LKNKRILKLVGSVFMVVVLTLTLVLISGCEDGDGEEGPITIGIFQIGSHPALDSAREGFKDAFKAALEAENLTEADVVFTESNAAFSVDACYTIADYFVAQGVDLICAIATPPVIAAATAVNGTDIPVVFNSVTNPGDVGIDDWDEPGGQVTGVSDLAPVQPQLELIIDILEDPANNITLEKLGVLYNSGESNSVYQVDTQLPEALDDLGLTGNVTVVKSTAGSGSEISTATMTLVYAEVDAIWVPTDNTVVGGIESAVGPCEENDIPLFAADTSTVERGVIGCWGMDYYLVGYESGEMAAEILLEGANPATMAIRWLPADLLYLYPQAAVRMGVTIPEWLIDMADVVVTD
jgi:putative ABC transport system substrate-binding protein